MEAAQGHSRPSNVQKKLWKSILRPPKASQRGPRNVTKETLEINTKATLVTGRSTDQFFLLENLLDRARTKAHLTVYPWTTSSISEWHWKKTATKTGPFCQNMQLLVFVTWRKSSSGDRGPLKNFLQVAFQGDAVKWAFAPKLTWLCIFLYFLTWRKFCSSWCHLGRTLCQCCTPRSVIVIVIVIIIVELCVNVVFLNLVKTWQRVHVTTLSMYTQIKYTSNQRNFECNLGKVSGGKGGTTFRDRFRNMFFDTFLQWMQKLWIWSIWGGDLQRAESPQAAGVGFICGSAEDAIAMTAGKRWNMTGKFSETSC